MSVDLDGDDVVYIGTNARYTASFHKVPDCKMLRQNNAEYRERTLDQVQPQHEPCQDPDCWGSREDRDEPTCPLCGEVFYGEQMPLHIFREHNDEDPEVDA